MLLLLSLYVHAVFTNSTCSCIRCSPLRNSVKTYSSDFMVLISIKARLFFSKDKTIDVRKPKGVAFNVLLAGNESADILLKASETRRPRKLQVQWIYQAWIANQSTRKWIYSLVWYTLNSTIIGLIREVRCFNWQHMLLTDINVPPNVFGCVFFFVEDKKCSWADSRNVGP